MNLRPTPARTAALVFGLLALAAVLAWNFVDSAATDAWMPAAATGAATIALTVTLVEGIVERERRDRGAGRRAAAYERLEDGFLNLTFALTFDTKGRAEPGDPIELIEQWLSIGDDTPHYSTDTVFSGIRSFAERVGRVLDDDGDVLPHELRAAMVEVRERALELTGTLATDVNRPHHPLLGRTALRAVVELAKELRRERGNNWMAVRRRLRRIDLVHGGAAAKDAPASNG